MFKYLIAIVVACFAIQARAADAKQIPQCSAEAKALGQKWVADGYEYKGVQALADGQLFLFATKATVRVMVFKSEPLKDSQSFKYSGPCQGDNGQVGYMYAAEMKNEET